MRYGLLLFAIFLILSALFIGASVYSFQGIDVADGVVTLDSRTHWGWRSERQSVRADAIRELALRHEGGRHDSHTVVVQTSTGEIPLGAYASGSHRRAEGLLRKLQAGLKTEGFHDRRYGNLFLLPVGVVILIAAGFQLRRDIRAEAALGACERQLRDELEPSIFRRRKRPARFFVRKRPADDGAGPLVTGPGEAMLEDAGRGDPLPY